MNHFSDLRHEHYFKTGLQVSIRRYEEFVTSVSLYTYEMLFIIKYIQRKLNNDQFLINLEVKQLFTKAGMGNRGTE